MNEEAHYMKITLEVKVEVELKIKEGATLNLQELMKIKEDALQTAKRMLTERRYTEGTEMRIWSSNSEIFIEPSEIPF